MRRKNDRSSSFEALVFHPIFGNFFPAKKIFVPRQNMNVNVAKSSLVDITDDQFIMHPASYDSFSFIAARAQTAISQFFFGKKVDDLPDFSILAFFCPFVKLA